MRNIIVALVLVGAPALFATKMTWWDGTISYNIVSIEETEKAVLIGVRTNHPILSSSFSSEHHIMVYWPIPKK